MANFAASRFVHRPKKSIFELCGSMMLQRCGLLHTMEHIRMKVVHLDTLQRELWGCVITNLHLHHGRTGFKE